MVNGVCSGCFEGKQINLDNCCVTCNFAAQSLSGKLPYHKGINQPRSPVRFITATVFQALHGNMENNKEA